MVRLASQDAAARDNSRAAVAVFPMIGMCPMRVLVIEDQPQLRRLVVEMLEQDGYAVDSSSDGVDGLAKAQSWPYDAIILEMMLPKLDGWDLLEMLRATHSTPVLVLSARDALSDRVLGLDLGADDYLAKPFERAELLARLRALIRRAAGKPAMTVVLGDVRIDLRARSATREGETISLTAREYGLLEYLVLHRGKVVSRTELYDHLFDANDDSCSNTLDVYVSYLRKKLGPGLIETRRGLGYVIPD
jgi:two-component system OmpR family response regulator